MSNPSFISWLGHGAASLAPPGVFSDAKTHLFVIDASTAAVQKLADDLLNRAGSGVVCYKALLPVAMLSFMDIAKCTSSTDIMGWLPGRECAFWVPLLELHPGHPLRTRLVFWAPYIFINYTIGMLTGREAWGWPKVGADIAVESDTPADPRFSCTTTFFPTMAASTRGMTDVLYRVVRNGAAREQPPPAWNSAEEALKGLVEGCLAGVPDELLEVLQLRPQLPSVVLMQFRSAGAPGAACFQAIVDSPIELTGFSGGGLLLDNFTLEITTCESHGIVSDLLGRAPDNGSTKLPVKFAAWVTIDFQAVSGGNIVVVP